MAGRSKYDFAGLTPHKNNYGMIGTPSKKWYAVYADNIYDTPQAYSSDPMTEDETFTDPESATKIYFLNPGSAKRTFNPSGDFNTGFTAFVKNTGTTFSIVFDGAASKQLVRPKQTGIFMYDGTVWV